jgi:hypothetical protein
MPSDRISLQVIARMGECRVLQQASGRRCWAPCAPAG